MAETIRRLVCRSFAKQVGDSLKAGSTDDTLVVLHNGEVPQQLDPGTRVVNIVDGEWESPGTGAKDTRGPHMRQHVVIEAIVSVPITATMNEQEVRDALADALDDLYRRVLLAVLADPTIGGKAYGVIEELAGETTLPGELGTQPTAGFSVEFAIPYEALGVQSPKTGDKWALNVLRGRGSSNPKWEMFSQWVMTCADFNSEKHFGELLFK